jgi:hypothetical protein
MRFRETHRRVAPVSKDGAAPWFETPRTRLRNLGRSKVAAPHHEAGRDRECIKLTGIRFSVPAWVPSSPTEIEPEPVVPHPAWRQLRRGSSHSIRAPAARRAQPRD